MNELSRESFLTPEERASQHLEAFLSNPGLTELAALFGEDDLPADAPGKLAKLQEVAAQHWDFRKGAERQQTSWDVEGELGKEGSDAWKTVFAAATKLGQVESSQPQNRRPDYLVVLGGANLAPDQRLQFGLESVDDPGIVVYMGSSRAVQSAERQKADGYLTEEYRTKEKLSEYDLGCAAFEMRLPHAVLTSSNEAVRNGDVWAWREYTFEHNGEAKTAFALNTPIEIHAEDGQVRRATTYDNYKFFAEQAELADNQNTNIVAVTTAFYIPGQHLAAVQEVTLPYGVAVETIGHSAEYSGVTRKPSQLLQEVKAGVDAAVRLQEAIIEAKAQAPY